MISAGEKNPNTSKKWKSVILVKLTNLYNDDNH